MLTLLGVGQGQVSTSFDADYQAVLDRATTLGYDLPTLAQQNLQNQLLIDLKAVGVWDKLDVFYNFAFSPSVGGVDFATLNWKAPTLNQCTLFNSITFISNEGFQGNGIDTYIDTNFQLASGVNYTLNNASRYIWMSIASGTGVFDGNSVASTNTIRRQSSSAQRINQGATGVSPIFDYNSTSGLKSIHRTSVTNITLFNGNASETRIVTSAVVTSANHLILRSQAIYGAHTIGMFSAGASLVTENTDFLNAYTTYINSI
jgi:hypothetical protein